MNAELLGQVDRAVLGWPGVSKQMDRGGTGRGGFRVPPFTSYRLGRREIGHVHHGGVADLTFTRRIHDELIAAGRAEPHGAGFAGVVSYHIRQPEDVPRVLELFRLNYGRLKESVERRER